MTHESFKQILSWSDTYTREDVCKFLDNSFECPVLEQWFALWQKGKQRQIFDEIKSMNLLRANTNKNSPEMVPLDYEKPRDASNDNFGELQRRRQWKQAEYELSSRKKRRLKK